MIRLVAALLTLGVITATVTTVAAQPGWNDCNPDAPRCRIYGSPSPLTTQQGWRPRTRIYHHAHHHHAHTQ
jgi:hypothetical protein